MSDGLPDRLQQLRQRWAADPASRVFLQLAEEYRHLGRVQDALTVLDGGLREHPGYLSALVAKGRCHLELGQPEAAREALERVVRQDATQMVANKLLVRAYLETAQVDRARERLDLYSLLHDGDPEIEELRGRIRRMEAPRMDSSSSYAPPATAARGAGPAPVPAGDDIFDLAPPAAVPEPAAGDDLFDLGLPPAVQPPAAAATHEEAEGDETADLAAGESFAATGAAGVAAEEPDPEPDSEAERAAADLFPHLASRAIRSRYLEGLAAEGLFLLDLAEVPAPRFAAVRRETAALHEAPPSAAPLPAAGGELFDLGPDAEPVASPVAEAPPFLPEPAAEPPRAEPLAASPAAVAPDLFGLDAAPAEASLLAAAPPALSAPSAAEAFAPEAEQDLAAPLAPASTPEPAEDLAALLAPAPAPEPLAAPPAGPASVPRLAPAELFAPREAAPEFPPAPATVPEPQATVTLGELYLRQGHLEEAGHIFREVLGRDPGNPAAQEGLERATQDGLERAAVDPAAGGSRRTRTIARLNSYLERLRRGSQRDVS